MAYQLEDFSSDLRLAVQTARAAGEAIMPLYRRQDIKRAIKVDQSEVSEADYRSNDVIVSALRAADPVIPILSEETKDEFIAEYPVVPGTCWIIDPLDGTSIFLLGQTGFLVLIARMENHKPVLSVAHHPATNETYFAEKGVGSFKIDAQGNIRKLWRDAVDKNHPLRQRIIDIYEDPVAEAMGQSFAKSAGFSNPVQIIESLDAPHLMLAIAENRSDLCLHYLNKKYRDQKAGAGVWDHAPMDLILHEANCVFMDNAGQDFVYTNAGHISQMSVSMAPGLDPQIMVREIERQLLLNKLPKPIN
jgi:3'-phosphoadenosine 5'-phosphosulfate (PAPS) 3'-phosphatase